MNFKKSAIVASSLVFALSTHLFAQEVYTIQNKTLKEALEIISKKSNLSYLASDKLLEIKKTNNIKNVEGLENALEELFKGTGIKAVIRKDAIVIIEETSKNNNNTDNSLGEVDVIERASNATEGTGSYTIESMNTATKLNLSIKDTPQSVVVLTDQEIKDKVITNFRSLADNVVGLDSASWDSNRVWIWSRGFEVDYYQIDGVSTTYDPYDSEENLTIYDRVEIVRGANGLVNGAGNPAASINLVRKHANSKEFKGDLTLKAGSWDTYSGTIDLSLPLNEEGTVRTRFIAQKESKEAFVDIYEKDSTTLYAALDADLSDQTKVSLGVSSIKSDASGVGVLGAPYYFSDGTKTNFDRDRLFVPKWTVNNKELTSVFANIEHIFLNDVKVYAGYLYDHGKTFVRNATYLGHPDKITGLGLNMDWGAWQKDSVKKSHVIDLYSSIPFDFAGQDHEFLIGATYSKTKDSGDFSDELNDVPGQSVYDWDGNFAKPAFGEPEDDYEENKQSALYTVARFNLTDSLKLIAGGRLTNFKYDSNNFGDPSSYEVKNIFTPYAGLVYDINENHSAYVSYSNIFKTQQARDIGGNLLDPKEGNNYEVGIKGEYFDKKLNAGLTLFRIEQDNVAEYTGLIIPGSNGETAYESLDGVTSKGFEIFVKGEIDEHWTVDMGYSSFEKEDRDGNELTRETPKKQFVLNAKYKFDKLTLGGGVKWRDDMYVDWLRHPTLGTTTLEEKDFFTFNALAKYDFTKDLSLQLNIDNLFDKEYFSAIEVNGPSYIEPRKTTFTLNYKF